MSEHNKYVQIVFDTIRKYASKEKPICAKEIFDRITGDTNNSDCDRKTIERALDRLRCRYGTDPENGGWIDENIRLHYRVVPRKSSPIFKDYWLDVKSSDELTPEEVMYLIDAVQYSKHINDRKAETLIKKIKAAANTPIDREFSNYRLLTKYDRTTGNAFFENIEKINRAIAHGKRVSFTDNEYGIDKKLHPKERRKIVADPYYVVVVDGNYYVLCTKKDSSAIKSYRIDRLTNVEEKDEVFPVNETVKKIMSDPGEYIIEHRYMNSGRTISVVLLADQSIIGDLIDSFGTRISIVPAGEGSERVAVRFKSSEKDILNWAIQYGTSAEIVSPLYLRNEIENRILSLRNTYSDRGRSEIDYLDAVNDAQRRKSLLLRNIDLNGYESYKTLENVIRINMQRNHISDFSFLENYHDLRELVIAHNHISDPEDLSCLNRLVMLGLENTGITDLDFLGGMEDLRQLAIHEYTLENVEAVYSLPCLIRLKVNKMTAELIDKARLMRVYGSDFNYMVDDSPVMNMFMSIRNDLPPQRPGRLMTEMIERCSSGFTTFRLEGRTLRDMLCARINSGGRWSHSRREKDFYIVEGSCEEQDLVGFFREPEYFTGDDYTWFITYRGEQPGSQEEIDLEKVYHIAILRNDGSKIAAMAARMPNRAGSKEERYKAMEHAYDAQCAAVRYIIDNRLGWLEAIGELEFMMKRVCTREDAILPRELIGRGIYSSLDIDADDYHYYRPDGDGLHTVRKIAFGHLE